ncbi:MAG: sensor histidine kinase, partial [Roseibium sp.]
DVLAKIGDPYVSVRSDKTARKDAGGGLGLGFFIAKTLLERTGAKLFLENRAPPEHGAHIRVTWPRAAIESLGHMDGQDFSLHKG